MVVKNRVVAQHEVNAPLIFNTLIGKMTIPFDALNVPEGMGFPAQMDVHDAEGTLIGYTDSEGNDCGPEDTELIETPPQHWTDGQGG